MKNAVIPKNEVKKMEEVIKAVNELIEVHEKTRPNVSAENSNVERVHTILVLEALKDVVTSVKILEDLMNVSEEEFVKEMTEDGKYTFEHVEKRVMTFAMLKMLKED